MKKNVLLILVSCSPLLYAQERANKKFQLGISYSLTGKEEIFAKPFSGYANFQLKRFDNIDLNIGLRTFYFNSRNSTNFSNKWGFNPNISSSYYLKDTQLLFYFGLGYYYDSYKFYPTQLDFFTTPNRDLKTNGITVTPGLKYFVHSNVFIDANLSLLSAKTKDDLGFSESSNNTFLNIGLGVAF